MVLPFSITHVLLIAMRFLPSCMPPSRTYKLNTSKLLFQSVIVYKSIFSSKKILAVRFTVFFVKDALVTVLFYDESKASAKVIFNDFIFYMPPGHHANLGELRDFLRIIAAI
jgi:hypothetical protein